MTCYLVTGTAGFVGWKVAELCWPGDIRSSGWTTSTTPTMCDSRNGGWGNSPAGRSFTAWTSAGVRSWRNSRRSRRGSPSMPWSSPCSRHAPGSLFRREPWVYVETNTMGTLNLLDLCRRFGVAKFVLASSSSVYGQVNPLPYRKMATRPMPVSPYAASKKAAEALCYTYHYLHGLDVTVLRYFTVYGPAGRPDMLPFRLVQWISEGRPVTIFGDGSQSRDFTYIEDIAGGTIAALALRGLRGHQPGGRSAPRADGRDPAGRGVDRSAGAGRSPRPPHAADARHLGQHRQGAPLAGLAAIGSLADGLAAWWPGINKTAHGQRTCQHRRVQYERDP